MNVVNYVLTKIMVDAAEKLHMESFVQWWNQTELRQARQWPLLTSVSVA